MGRSSDGLRLPPHSIEAEQSVLGGLMLDAAAWDQVADRVSPKISTATIIG
jgi:replicative DNA helicase